MLAFSKLWCYVRLHAESVVLCPGKGIRSPAAAALSMSSGVMAYRSGAGAGLSWLSWVEGFLDAPGRGGCDVLVDGKCLFQAGGAFAGVAVAEVAVADALQGPCSVGESAEVAGDDQRLGVVVAGLAAIASPGR